MADFLYQFLAGVLDLTVWGGKLVGEENLPSQGPAVFVANHLDALGPIAGPCAIPLRLYSWIQAEMLDKEMAVDWLEWDLIRRVLHIKPPLSLWISKVMCSFSVPILHALGCIPVYRGDYARLQTTLRMSIDLLREGKFLMIFPEDNRYMADPVTKMMPFQHTFARLGEMYFQETGKRLQFYPVTIHGSGVLQVHKPVAFNPLNQPGVERHRIKDLMETTITATYLQLENQEVNGALTPERK
jgi:1-acyl-sn-glycerol-3-phosphate acyltransferase